MSPQEVAQVEAAPASPSHLQQQAADIELSPQKVSPEVAQYPQETFEDWVDKPELEAPKTPVEQAPGEDIISPLEVVAVEHAAPVLSEAAPAPLEHELTAPKSPIEQAPAEDFITSSDEAVVEHAAPASPEAISAPEDQELLAPKSPVEQSPAEEFITPIEQAVVEQAAQISPDAISAPEDQELVAPKSPVEQAPAEAFITPSDEAVVEQEAPASPEVISAPEDQELVAPKSPVEQAPAEAFITPSDETVVEQAAPASPEAISAPEEQELVAPKSPVEQAPAEAFITPSDEAVVEQAAPASPEVISAPEEQELVAPKSPVEQSPTEEFFTPIQQEVVELAAPISPEDISAPQDQELVAPKSPIEQAPAEAFITPSYEAVVEESAPASTEDISAPEDQELIAPKSPVEQAPAEEFITPSDQAVVEEAVPASPEDIAAPEDQELVAPKSPVEQAPSEEFIAPSDEAVVDEAAPVSPEAISAPQELEHEIAKSLVEQEPIAGEVVIPSNEPVVEQVAPASPETIPTIKELEVEVPKSPIEQTPADEIISPSELAAVEEAAPVSPPQAIPAPKEPEITQEVIKGEVESNTNTEDSEETLEDGSTIKRTVTTTEYTRPVTTITICEGVETTDGTSELIGSEVDETITELPEGLTEMYGEGISTETFIEEFEESMPDGTWLKKKTHRTKVTRLQPSPTELDKIQVVSPIELQEQAQPVVLPMEVQEDIPVSAIYKVSMEERTPPGQEQAPENVEEEYEEFEEILPDGTVIHKRIIITRTQSTIIKKVITEMPNGDVSEEVIRQDISGPTLEKHVPVEQMPGDFEKEPSPIRDDDMIMPDEFQEAHSAPPAPASGPTLEKHVPVEQMPGDFVKEASPIQDDDMIMPDEFQEALSAPPAPASGPTLEKHVPVEQMPDDVVKEPSPVCDEDMIIPDEFQQAHSAPPAPPVIDRPHVDEDLIAPDMIPSAYQAPQSPPPGEDYDEVEETLPDGTVVKRRIITTKVKKMVTKKIRRVGPDGEVIEDVVTEEVPESELSETSSLRSSLSEARDAISPIPSSPMELASPAESDSDKPSVRVYTDTIEGEPEIETEVQEFEETLPDGTIIKRKVIKTRQKQTVIKRVVMEGPEEDLPSSEEQAQIMLNQGASVFEPDVYGYTDTQTTEPETSTDVQEFEETLPDGTTVKRKVVTSTEQQLTTERTVMEGFGHVPGMVAPDDLAAIEDDALQYHQEGPIKIDMSAPAESAPTLEDEDMIMPDIQVREALPQYMPPEEPIDDDLIEVEMTSEAQSAPPTVPMPQEIQEDDIVPVVREEEPQPHDLGI